MRRKAILVVTMAIAFAAPASAGAVEWKHEGATLTTNEVLELTGPYCWAIGETGWCSQLELEVEIFKHSNKGKLTKLKGTDCTGFGGLAPLTCTNTPVGEWVVEATANGTILIDNISITNHYYSPADPTHSKILTSSTLTGDIVATPDSSTAFGSVVLEGWGTKVGGAESNVEGELEVNPAGTYGIS